MSIIDADNNTDFSKTEKTILKFYTKSCGPCKVISPTYVTLSKEFSDVTFYEIDVDKNENLADKYGIAMMPTFVAIVNGNEVNRFSGADKSKLRIFVEKLNNV